MRRSDTVTLFMWKYVLLIALVVAAHAKPSTVDRLREAVADMPRAECRAHVSAWTDTLIDALVHNIKGGRPAIQSNYLVEAIDCPNVEPPGMRAQLFFDGLCGEHNLFVICNTTHLVRDPQARDPDGKASLAIAFAAYVRDGPRMKDMPCACILPSAAELRARGASVPDIVAEPSDNNTVSK
jgi:hypothetical protein